MERRAASAVQQGAQCTGQAVQALETSKTRRQVVLLHSLEGPHTKALPTRPEVLIAALCQSHDMRDGQYLKVPPQILHGCELTPIAAFESASA